MNFEMILTLHTGRCVVLELTSLLLNISLTSTGRTHIITDSTRLFCGFCGNVSTDGIHSRTTPLSSSSLSFHFLSTSLKLKQEHETKMNTEVIISV